MNLPPSWPKMAKHNKAAYLANTFQAKDYSHAMRLIPKADKQFSPPASFVPSQKKEYYWWQKD